jgi:glucans biosynthesis protein
MTRAKSLTHHAWLQVILSVALLGIVQAAAAPAPKPGAAPAQFSPGVVDDLARALSQKPYEANHAGAPESLRKLGAKAYNEIRFNADRAFFADSGSSFRAQLYHLGYLYNRGVAVNLVTNGTAFGVPYSTELFTFGNTHFDRLPPETGYGGLRLHYPLNTPDVYDEMISFLGASNFRVLGRGQSYGLHARGLSIDTALPSGEEFPYFREFWVETPRADATAILMHALLDSPSVTGAYHFKITPGAQTVVDVSALIFARKDVKKLGLAPMASMFFYGENQNRTTIDYRPEVHSSDGLLIHNGADEWLWRPLRNPEALAVSDFVDNNVRGFGLMQRDRNFDHYQDLATFSQNRPSYWIEPLGDWGEGMVELVEIPTPDESNENILAYWTPKQGLKANESRTFSYRLHAVTTVGSDDSYPGGRVVATYQKKLNPPDVPDDEKNIRRFMVDFSGGDLGYYLKTPNLVEAAVTASAGEIVARRVEPHPGIGGFRAVFDIKPKENTVADLRVYLRARGQALTETWLLPWKAEE